MPKTREIKVLEQKIIFIEGVDKKGNYWKKYKNFQWKKIEFKEYELKTIQKSKVVYADTESYVTKGKENGDLIKRDCCLYKIKQEIRNIIKQCNSFFQN